MACSIYDETGFKFRLRVSAYLPTHAMLVVLYGRDSCMTGKLFTYRGRSSTSSWYFWTTACETLSFLWGTRFLWGIRYLVRNSELYARGIGGVFYHDSFWGPYLQRAAKLKLRKKRQCCRLFLTQFFAVPSRCVLDFCSTVSFCVRFCNSGSVCNKVLLHHLCAPEIFAAPAPCVIFLRLQYCSVYSIHICGSGW